MGDRALRLASIAISVAVFPFLADVLDRDDMLVLRGVEHDDALGRATSDADSLHRATDELALIGHQHDLIGVFDRERYDQLAVPVVDRHGDDPFAAASGGTVLIRRCAL